MRTSRCAAFCAAAALASPLVLSAAAPAKPAFTQDDARAIIGELQKVVSPRGIDERKEVTLGGIRRECGLCNTLLPANSSLSNRFMAWVFVLML